MRHRHVPVEVHPLAADSSLVGDLQSSLRADLQAARRRQVSLLFSKQREMQECSTVTGLEKDRLAITPGTTPLIIHGVPYETHEIVGRGRGLSFAEVMLASPRSLRQSPFIGE